MNSVTCSNAKCVLKIISMAAERDTETALIHVGHSEYNVMYLAVVGFCMPTLAARLELTGGDIHNQGIN